MLGVFLDEVRDCVASENGEQLRDAFLFRGAMTSSLNASKMFASVQDEKDLLRRVRALRLPAPFLDVTVRVCAARMYEVRDELDKVVESLSEGARTLAMEMVKQRESGNWWLPAFDALTTLLCARAKDADDAAGGGQATHSKQASELLRDVFSKFVQDRSPLEVSKKRGLLAVGCALMRLYFRINRVLRGKNLDKIISSPNVPALDTFPIAQQVTYSFYVSRILILDEAYGEAEQRLAFALQHCHGAYARNRRRILESLVPVRLLAGKRPHRRLLQKYELAHYAEVVEAVRRGQVALLESCIQRHQAYFIRLGVLFLLERLKEYTYRNAFRRIHAAYAVSAAPNKGHVVPLDVFLTGLRLLGTDIDEEELECLLANLLFKRLIKGYIAHGRAVVLSKADPFPEPKPFA